MNEKVLNDYIQKEIRKVVYSDRIEVFFPFVWGDGTEEDLCLIWDKKGTLSDKGFTFEKLKNRIGDITPCEEKINNILSAFGNVMLESGRILVVKDFQTCISEGKSYKDYSGGLNRLIRVITLISVVDSINVDKEGTVSLC